MKLLNKSKNIVLLNSLEVAKTLGSRMKGLLGRQSLTKDQALWIHSCSSIHTYFMKFPIDVILLDKHRVVVAIHKNVVPWRIVFPVWKASSVIECRAGVVEEWTSAKKLDRGDVLHVGD